MVVVVLVVVVVVVMVFRVVTNVGSVGPRTKNDKDPIYSNIEKNK